MAQPRPEDFGAVPIQSGVSQVRPEDFGAVAISPQRGAPKASDLPPTERLGKAAIGGFVQGGPLFMGLRTMQEGAKIGQENFDRSAYNVGGAVTDLATRAGASPEVAAGAGYTANVGMQALPVVVGAGMGSMFKQPMEAGSRYLMQSAMKPNQLMRESGAADRAATTMLERGISPTRGGREQLQNMVTTLETQIDDILKNSPATVDKYAVGATLRQAVDKVKTNLSARSDMQTIQASLDEFLNHPLLNNSSAIPVSLANQIKQSIYKTLGPNAFVPGVKTGVPRLADKTLARGLRENIAQAEPQVVAPLAEQAELLNALKVMTPQALRDGNRNLGGIGTIAPTLEQFLLWTLDRSALAKGLLARAMYQGSSAIPTTVGAAGGGLLGSQMGQPPQQ